LSGGLRIDLFLWRVRLAKSRSLAARLIGAGNVRLIRNGQAKRLEKPAAEVAPGDVIVFTGRSGVRSVRVLGLPLRRGPGAEAARHYAELDDGERLA
jgi:ribosome-associated heat shock protein Hsp15